MVRALLIRGMLAGLVAGLLVFGFARVFGEPQLDRAIGFEAAMQHDAADLVSRPVQAGIGLFTGVVVYAAAFGGLFALVFAVAHGRATQLGARAVSALLAGAGFVAVYVVPNLKYPANPPSVGEAETIGTRTALYFTMLAISVAAMVVAVALRSRFAERSRWDAALLAGAFYLVVVSVAAAVLPSVNEVPDDFPATLLWQFRVVSFGMQVLMWAALGLIFGWAAERALRADRRLVRGGLGHRA